MNTFITAGAQFVADGTTWTVAEIVPGWTPQADTIHATDERGNPSIWTRTEIRNAAL